ncbi:MAG: stage II sporulation protein M [Bacteroides sp.]|nr:stage II sporulation protein M [Bacteroides sp.]
MKELLFVRQNIRKWEETEKLIQRADHESLDRLADAYMDITTDLSFSQSHYPHSRITAYLNNLSSALHHQLYKNKCERSSRIITYWREEIPRVMAASRKELLYSFLIFAISAVIGAVSSLNDAGFARIIMGDRYIDMTLENIAQGDPLAVYKSASHLPMFMGITLNNIRVAFHTFAMGLFTGIGTGYILFSNGVMLGAFQTFFLEHELLFESMLTIWIHGTLEISAIIVAGAAGLALGNSWLFPGTYSRIESFKRGAKRGVKILIGTLPIFIIAGFLEGFVTRYTGLLVIVRGGIILFSFAFVLYYYLYLPKHINDEQATTKN